MEVSTAAAETRAVVAWEAERAADQAVPAEQVEWVVGMAAQADDSANHAAVPKAAVLRAAVVVVVGPGAGRALLGFGSC
jgi:predicted P-loop ATPase/GTPase